jgi:uncharacterized protein with GYD domain
MGIRPTRQVRCPLGKGAAVATFVSLINWTDQGVKSFRDSGKRADAFTELVQSKGGNVKAIYWTLGQYDIVAITEAPDAETATAVLLQPGRSETCAPPRFRRSTAIGWIGSSPRVEPQASRLMDAGSQELRIDVVRDVFGPLAPRGP